MRLIHCVRAMLRAGHVRCRNDAWAVGEFEETRCLDFKAQAPAATGFQRRDIQHAKHLAAHRKDQIIAPFDVFGDAGPMLAVLA